MKTKKTWKLKKIILVVLLAVWLTGPQVFAQNPRGDITWTGCGITKKAFMAEAAEAYKKKTGKTIVLSGGGATKGVRDAASGKTDIGGSCRPAKPDLTDKEKGVKMTHVAWDALVIMVHPDNPVNGLTTDQVTKIFRGEIRNWKDVGGIPAAIAVVVRRGKVSGVGYMSRLMLFNDSNANFYRKSINLKSSGPVEKKVEKKRNAIGISGVSSAKRRKVKLLALNGMKPTKENVMNGRYPYFRPLYLITKGEPKGEVKAFLDWLLSKEGQEVVSKAGTVNLEEGKDLVKKFKYWENVALVSNYKK